MEYTVIYTEYVIDFIVEQVTSKRVYEKIDGYREVLASFPDIGKPYDPMYRAARPPFPCRSIPVPDTPFTLYYLKDDDCREVVVFFIEHQALNPEYR
ncbi:MAG: type II toxin-antitoxin system RelE/ParE family toxin, partial [Raoultibacter sp.]